MLQCLVLSILLCAVTWHTKDVNNLMTKNPLNYHNIHINKYYFKKFKRTEQHF